MLTAHLEDRFRQALGEPADGDRAESVRFAIDFSRLLARMLPDEVAPPARAALAEAIAARTDLLRPEIELLLRLVLAPENRAAVDEDDLRAFGARFGRGEAEALRAAAAEELDLRGFAEQYGAAESLLLLDALFAVCAVDGVVDQDEIAQLTRAADELGIDAMLVGALFRKHDLRHAAGDFTFDLEGDRFVIGRSAAADVQLPDPQVANRHAELLRTDEGWRVRDLGSGRPTLLHGQPVSAAPLHPGDQLRVGPYTLALDRDARTLTAFGASALQALSVRNLHRRIGDLVLLDGVSFTVFSGEVIALVGPSGSGKTTLLNAIAGITPADSGDVLLDGDDFHAMLATDRSLVGIVPQDDVVHPELTVTESLFYSARLRYPRDVGKEALRQQVDRVLGELGIEHIAGSRIGDALRRGISGGQRKRVNLGQELLTQGTRVLFLDEPTSGLDPRTAQDIVSLVRQLADDGRIVFLVTHDVSPSIVSMVDHLVVLAPGGRLAWFGPPDEACAWFGVRSSDEIFARLPAEPPTTWSERYRASPAWRKLVRTREHLLGVDGLEVEAPSSHGHPVGSPLLQYLTLTRRTALVKVRDTSGTAVLLAQAPILGLATWVVFPEPDTAAMFVIVLSALWFGTSGAVRELIAERTIWRREQRVGVGVLPYVASKITVLGALVALQCVVLAGIAHLALDMSAYGFSFPLFAGVTTLTGLVGMSLGLLMSALFSSSEAAVGTLPLLLVPQITFGGLIVKVKEMSALAKGLSALTITRYGFEAVIKTGDELSRPAAYGREREPLPLPGVLYDLGFRGTGADDMGLPLWALCALLTAFFTAFVGAAAVLTARRPPAK